MDNGESNDNDDLNTDDCSFDAAFINNSPTNDDEIGDEQKYEILNVYKIITLMSEAIDEVQKVIQLPRNVIRVLLNYLKWDVQRLYDRYFEDERKLFKDANIEYPLVIASPLVNPNASDDEYLENIFCHICFCEIPIYKMHSLECGHIFCLSCWDQYLTSKITQEDVCNGIKCAEHGCGTIVSDDIIINLITNAELKSRYMHLITNGFVLTNRLLRWCSAPNCFNAAKVELSEFISVKCTCGNTFCFLCGENRHKPAHCDIIRRWIRKCEGRSEDRVDCETANWLLVNTKECPKCKASIEKNGGCNHMTCRNINCRFEFCWLCLKGYDGTHTGCNRYDGDSTDTVNAKSRLMRYLHFWQRFQNHMQSLKSEKKLKEKVSTKMSELQIKESVSWIDVQYLIEAIAVLCECRETLMYSYAFAYYLCKSNISEIFEMNQEHLEVSTEKLSRYLEIEWTDLIDSKDMKINIMDCSKHCKNRRHKLIKHVDDGYENAYWEFIPND